MRLSKRKIIKLNVGDPGYIGSGDETWDINQAHNVTVDEELFDVDPIQEAAMAEAVAASNQTFWNNLAEAPTKPKLRTRMAPAAKVVGHVSATIGLKTIIVSGAVLNATIGTAVNPWLENPKGLRNRWYRSIEDLDLNLDADVKACPDCHVSATSPMYREGTTNWDIDMTWREEPKRPNHAHNSHCPKHWKRVQRNQWRQRRVAR